jgi:gluconolactonase
MGASMNEVYQVLDDHFRTLIDPDAPLRKHWTGGEFGEGPAYFPAGRYLVWSDIPNDRILRYDECSDTVSTFRHPSGFANGNTVDRQGRLVTCEHRGRRVSRTEHDGSITVVAERYQGKLLNSPNDVVVQSNGAVWFTDPTYGIDDAKWGLKADSEIGHQYVYRVDAKSGRIEVVADDFIQPNGLAFSPDEKRLYIVDTGRTHVKDGPFHMRVFDVADGGTLSGGRVFAECNPGAFDGFRIDAAGNIWTSGGGGILCYRPDGVLIGKIKVPEGVANVSFGGPERNRLYIAATKSLYSVDLRTKGDKTV